MLLLIYVSLTFCMFCKTNLLNKKIPSRFMEGQYTLKGYFHFNILKKLVLIKLTFLFLPPLIHYKETVRIKLSLYRDKHHITINLRN